MLATRNNDTSAWDQPPLIGTTWGEDTARARRTDPIESHQAADSITLTKRGSSRAEVLIIMRDAGVPLTGDQIEEKHEERWRHGRATQHHTGQRLRTARAELVKEGLVAQSGVGKSRHGRNAAVWKLSEAGGFPPVDLTAEAAA